MSTSDLPWVNACLNGVSAVLLGLGYFWIRRGDRRRHRLTMLAALGTSVLFLCSYVTYHATVQAVTRFLEPTWFRPYYLAILLSHTVLATALVGLVPATLYRALKGQLEPHRRIARWTWPIWIYVSATGVLIYLLLYRIFPQTAGGPVT